MNQALNQRDMFFKWLYYAGATLLLVLVQSLVLNRIFVWGVHPFLPPLIAAITAMLEGPGEGTAFAGVFGLLCDLTMPGIIPCFYTLAFLAAALLVLFLRTRLGLSIRATGDNPDMVRASSINTAFTVTVGLCISNALTALSGAILAQYQKTADINLGTGMVIIGLASLIIGETLTRKGSVGLKAFGAVLGSILYRFIIALALRLDLPSECLKLISAVIVALAIGLPALRAEKKGAV